MYRYQNLRGLREKINELNNNFIIMYGALDNTIERIKLDNLEMFAKQLLKQTEECSNFLDENVIEMIEDNAYSLFILRLSEIKSILKISMTKFMVVLLLMVCLLA